MTTSSRSNWSGCSRSYWPGGRPHEEAGHHRLADVGPVEPAVQPRVAQPHPHLAADHRLVALDQLARRLIVAGANPTDEVGERGALGHVRLLPCRREARERPGPGRRAATTGSILDDPSVRMRSRDQKVLWIKKLVPSAPRKGMEPDEADHGPGRSSRPTGAREDPAGGCAPLRGSPVVPARPGTHREASLMNAIAPSSRSSRPGRSHRLRPAAASFPYRPHPHSR